MKSITNLPFILILVLLPITCFSQIIGTAVYISDGDTFYLFTERYGRVKVRVADIDCPERSQDFGLEAKEFVINEIEGKTVTLEVKGMDPYGRTIAFVKYDDKDLSEQLLINGLAWHYKKYSELESFSELEKQACEAKKGLWAASNPIAPWDYRKSRSN